MGVPDRLSCGLSIASTPSTASVCGPSCQVLATRMPVVVRRTLAAMGMDMPPSGTKGRRLKLSITWSARL